ncbi:biotin-dependent carboxyltransferase family protein [Aureibacillus halotolerans]|uniref:Antagonist of KipI n=1 Tax=Aureibacillus halotolerans TaxID=1508390 RepID=A0A4R6TY03_9BACI|nr:biotin-dependent carboxyltransferase family protein [Aureibacillus halotolerans]TDQ38788.1 antagonist of KipI [Aureibacillus halotolerans]
MKETPVFHVEKPGLLTSLQNDGRKGYQHVGLGPGGAIDPDALFMANLLVANELNTLAIECTLVGPELHCLLDGIIAITGADLSPTLNREPVPMWKAMRITKGDTLRFGKPIQGARAYISRHGGFLGQEDLGSGAYHSMASIGTLLTKNDVLSAHSLNGKGPLLGLSHEHHPVYKKHVTLAVVAGPHEERFNQKSTMAFYHSTFRVKHGNRMALTFEGENLTPMKGSLLSSGVNWGSIQVPPSGHPIVLLQDRQTTGGYPRIGTIASIHQAELAQLVTGDTVNFQPITIQQAQDKWREHLKQRRKLYARAFGRRMPTLLNKA